MVQELVTLGVVGLVLVVAIYLLRRAGEKSASRPKDAKDRVADLAEPEAKEPARRERKRDRVRPAAKHKKERKAAPEPEERDEEEEDQEEEAVDTGPTDEE